MCISAEQLVTLAGLSAGERAILARLPVSELASQLAQLGESAARSRTALAALAAVTSALDELRWAELHAAAEADAAAASLAGHATALRSADASSPAWRTHEDLDIAARIAAEVASIVALQREHLELLIGNGSPGDVLSAQLWLQREASRLPARRPHASAAVVVAQPLPWAQPANSAGGPPWAQQGNSAGGPPWAQSTIGAGAPPWAQSAIDAGESPWAQSTICAGELSRAQPAIGAASPPLAQLVPDEGDSATPPTCVSCGLSWVPEDPVAQGAQPECPLCGGRLVFCVTAQQLRLLVEAGEGRGHAFLSSFGSLSDADLVLALSRLFPYAARANIAAVPTSPMDAIAQARRGVLVLGVVAVVIGTIVTALFAAGTQKGESVLTMAALIILALVCGGIIIMCRGASRSTLSSFAGALGVICMGLC